jgi:hypothetical protein
LLEQQVGVAEPALPSGVAFLPVSPNPSHGPAMLVFRLPSEEFVRLQVMDLAGRTIATLADGVLPAGENRRVFARAGEESGVYFAVLSMPGGTRITRSMVVTR